MTDHVDVPIIATGDWIDAAWINQYIGDNVRAWRQGFVNAGDTPYALDGNTIAALAHVAGGVKYGGASAPAWLPLVAGGTMYGGASAPAWLPLVVGGMMYGGASAPAWLAKPSVDSFPKMGASGTPVHVPAGSMPGAFHVTGSHFTDSLINTSATSWTYTGNAFNFILDAPCTIFAMAVGMGYKTSASHEGYFGIAIDGTINPDIAMKIKSTNPTMFTATYIKTAVPAGARNVSLYYKTENTGDPVFLRSSQLYAMAFVER